MKTLKSLSNVERAKLLHELFPDEIPALLDFIVGYGEAFKEREAVHSIVWEHRLFSFGDWLSVLNKAEEKIIRYGKRLHQNSRLFSDQLFDGDMALYMADCLIIYTAVRKHPNPKFTIAIDLLFNL